MMSNIIKTPLVKRGVIVTDLDLGKTSDNSWSVYYEKFWFWSERQVEKRVSFLTCCLTKILLPFLVCLVILQI